MEYLMQENGFCKGVKLKRNPTWDETLYCLNEILGFDVDFTLNEIKEFDDDNDDIEQEKVDIHRAFTDFIQGECDWNWLCDVLYCYDDKESFPIGIFAYMLKYLETKEII